MCQCSRAAGPKFKARRPPRAASPNPSLSSRTHGNPKQLLIKYEKVPPCLSLHAHFLEAAGEELLRQNASLLTALDAWLAIPEALGLVQA